MRTVYRISRGKTANILTGIDVFPGSRIPARIRLYNCQSSTAGPQLRVLAGVKRISPLREAAPDVPKVRNANCLQQSIGVASLMCSGGPKGSEVTNDGRKVFSARTGSSQE